MCNLNFQVYKIFIKVNNMKFLVGVALSFSVFFSAAVPAWGEAVNAGLAGGKQIEGKIVNLTDSEMTLQTANGTQVYKVNGDIVKALKFSQGSDVIIDGSSLQTGRISKLATYDVEVELDNGEFINFVLSPEGRRTLGVGDRVVITSIRTPSRCQKIYRLESYTLMARDIKPQIIVVKTEPPAPSVEQPTPTPTPVEPAPVPVQPEAPVRGLW
jgi:outer membrane lipoprotein SlyB